MRYTHAALGRTFIVRLEDGEVVHEAIESLARREGIQAAVLVVLGGADEGSRLVVGPDGAGRTHPVHPLIATLSGVHEVAGVGTIFPDESGTPLLHLHLACGRTDHTTTGCARAGVKVWHVMEAVIIELTDTTALRRLEDPPGFVLLQP